jgi:uncharacterized protein (DUF927 family)
MRWAYRDGRGRLLGFVLRFDGPDGKEIRPLTLRDAGQGPVWTQNAFDAPRPLYGLDKLAARPKALVLMVEGEKAADAAAERFPELVVMTWPGGAKAVGKADLSPLAGRSVIIWPDADGPGLDAAKSCAKTARAAGAASVGVVSLPVGLPEGWDLADPWPAGFGKAQAEAAIKAARSGAERQAIAGTQPDASGVISPPGFRMDSASGLWWTERGDRGDRDQWVCDPFEVVGEARDSSGLGWAAVVRVRARDGQVRTVVISRAGLASGGADARRELADAGLRMATGQGIRERLTQFLMRVGRDDGRYITLTEKTGWHRGRFVLPDRTIGADESDPVLFTGDTSALKYGVRGDLGAWRREVAAKAPENPLLMFALSLAFAGPLLKLVGAEGGGFHLRGSSSSGKSSLLVAAGSVWGGDPNGAQHGYGHTWRSTANALESLATAHNDSLLCLDELAQVDPREAGVAAYALANGDGKKRQRPDGTLRQPARWRLILLSSGEIGLADHVASDGKGGRVAAGQELRLIDIAADAGQGFGIWSSLKNGETGAARSEALKAAAQAHYGHAGPLFVEKLIDDRDAALSKLNHHRETFRAEALKPGDSGQIARAVERFALIAAAGELAAEFGIVPWSWGDAIDAARFVFERWAVDFGRNGLREERQIIERVVGYIQTWGSEFVAADRKDGEDDEGQSAEAPRARSMRTSGVRHHYDGQLYYMFTKAAFQTALAGFAPQESARVLKARGFLLTDAEEGRLTKKKKHDGQPVNFYCVNARILSEADG